VFCPLEGLSVMQTSDDLLLQRMLQCPHEMGGLSALAWDRLIRLARVADLLARLGFLAQQAGVWAQIPASPRAYLASALLLADRQQRELGYEVQEIELALRSLNIPVVLLKGAAYVLAGLDAGNGRVVSDVDVLVPRAALPEVEAALMLGGWASAAGSAYDQRYYRTWMHELPPMQHIQRGTVLDVHHAILPVSARIHPSSELLLREARPLQPGSCLHVLAPIDMVLHSATHLMHEGNFEQGMRGLVDLDALLREHGRSPDFWPRMVARAVALQLTRPLFYALRYVGKVLGTAVPPAVLQELSRAPGAHPGAWRLKWMDAMFERVLCPPHALVADRWTPLARGFLYLRGHWLRMPPGLLARHLLRKWLSPKQGA
jgi:hypothetical protein